MFPQVTASKNSGLSRSSLSLRLLMPILAVLAIPGLARAQTPPDTGQSLPFKDIVFVERGIIGGSEYNGSHFCDEYFGHNGAKGGGLFLLKNWQSGKPEKVDIVAGLKVPAGSVNAGQALSSGTFLSPNLSFDGKTVVFAWSSGGGEKWTAKNRFHLFRVNLDGTDLFQITDGDYDDMHCAWMPNGRVVFISTRRGGYGRCHGRAVPTYTLHSVKADGTDLIRLSDHETNEFHPSIANDGRIVYMRWDYIDRDALAAHHIWFCNPDGANPRSWGGNYSYPLDTFSGANWSDGRKNGKRPQSEFYPHAIPGSMSKFVFTAGPHHGEAYGTLMIRDFSKIDDNELGQVTKITTDVGMPETADPGGGSVYGPAFPLSETLFLTSANNDMVLVDSSVKPYKKTTIYKGGMRPIYPQPVMARTPPPVIPPGTYQGERYCPQAPKATIQVNNVYVTDTYGKLPTGVKIKSMRIVQVLSKSTPYADGPRMGYSSQNVGKMVLGTVPVEEDGSVFAEAPIGKLILFQLLDENGMAVQNMRSATYVHPGESLTCIGCHEDKLAAPPVSGTPAANKRPPSKIEPELGVVEPDNYHRRVKPALERCYACHKAKGAGPTDTSYGAQSGYAWWFAGNANGNLEAVHGGSRSKPGYTGALGSKMGKALINATHKKALADGDMTAKDMRAVVMWLDSGSDEWGAFNNTDKQGRGELVWPDLDVDPNDPLGLTYHPEGKYSDKCPTVSVDGGAINPYPNPTGDGGAGTAGSTAVPTQTGGSTGPVGGAAGSTTGGAGGSGAQTGSGGQGGSNSKSTNGGGGQGGSQSVAPLSPKSDNGLGCSMSGTSGAKSHLWLLVFLGVLIPSRRIVRGLRRLITSRQD